MLLSRAIKLSVKNKRWYNSRNGCVISADKCYKYSIEIKNQSNLTHFDALYLKSKII